MNYKNKINPPTSKDSFQFKLVKNLQEINNTFFKNKSYDKIYKIIENLIKNKKNLKLYDMKNKIFNIVLFKIVKDDSFLNKKNNIKRSLTAVNLYPNVNKLIPSVPFLQQKKSTDILSRHIKYLRNRITSAL